jgi:membrane glycosyltransferase
LQGFVRAVVDPPVHALHIAMLGQDKKLNERITARRKALANKAFDAGPQALNNAEKKALLSDPVRLADLHRRVWALSDPEKAREWGLTAET